MICNFKTKVWLPCYVGVSPNFMIHSLDIHISFSMEDCGRSTQTKPLLQEQQPGLLGVQALCSINVTYDEPRQPDQSSMHRRN